MQTQETNNSEDNKQNIQYQRLAIKGFQWLQQQLNSSNVRHLGSTGFKKFRIQDEKKKWKKKNCKCFQGLGQKIEKKIRANSQLRQNNVSDIRKSVFDKTLEQISLKNNFQKIHNINKVSQIYQKQKNYRNAQINNFFNQQIQWIDKWIGKQKK